MSTPLSERARGRWTGLLPLLGVASSFLSNRQGPCPICGGKTRFRYDDREGRGTWICNHCGAGDGADLAMKVLGVDFKELLARIEPLIGDVAPRSAPKRQSEASCRDGLNRLWRSAGPVRPGDPVARYLAARCGLVAAPGCLRTVDRLRYQDDPPSWHPAMVAMVLGPDGAPATLHRTYLSQDGRKADVPAPRRVMPGTIPDGAAIRLFDAGPTLGIAEGIETAFAAAALFGVPCWAALNSTMLEKWIPPSGVEEVVIFGDADEAYGGQASAYALARRLTRSIARVRVEIPAEAGTDWCDVYAGEKRAA